MRISILRAPILGRLLITVAAFAFTLPCAAAAQTIGTSEDTLVYRADPLVVTATRGPRELSRTPRPVSVVQRRDLVQQMPNTVSDLFRTLPGLDVTGVGVNQGRPQIRGQTGQRILLLSDGMRLNNSRRQQDFGELPALVDINGVERVEVVRGPASVLYGSDAIGGVVNIISKLPQAEGLHGTANVRYGGVENQKAGSFRTYGRFGALTLRAGGTYREADAYRAPGGSYGNITLANDVLVDGTGTQDQSFDLRLGYDRGGNHTTFGKVERYEAENSGFGSVDPSLYEPTGTPTNITYPYQTYTKVSGGYRGQELGTALADQFEFLVYGQQNDRQLSFGIGPFGIGPGMAMSINTLNTTGIRSYGMRAEARKLAAPGLLFTYGLDAWRDRAIGTDEGLTTMTGFGPNPLLIEDNRPQLPEATYLSAGLFLQAEVELSDRFSVVAGTRWQHVKAQTFATVGLEDQTPADITDGTLVAAVNSMFRVSDQVSLIGSVGRAFRSPNIIERFFDGPTPEGSGYQVRNAELEPETSLNVDLGVRVRQGRLGFETFIFRNEINGGIRIQGLGTKIGGFPAYQNVNVDQLLFRGMEVGADLGLGAGFSTAGSFTWMDSQNVLDVENPVGESFSSKVTGTVRYDAPDNRFWAAGGIRHNAEQLEVDFGADNPVGDLMPAFTVLNLRGGITLWTSDSGMTHKLNIAVTNLTNQLYAEFSNVGFFRPEPKRSLTLTWDVSF
ncbi:MAG: TonB-dependent receptor [Gemmatimonadetes bacterium]|nr:TonB-dependent receptor [Gemmatimonadota bacterium]